MREKESGGCSQYQCNQDDRYLFFSLFHDIRLAGTLSCRRVVVNRSSTGLPMAEITSRACQQPCRVPQCRPGPPRKDARLPRLQQELTKLPISPSTRSLVPSQRVFAVETA